MKKLALIVLLLVLLTGCAHWRQATTNTLTVLGTAGCAYLEYDMVTNDPIDQWLWNQW